eukprot:COSAG04_NODE_30374_length_263_cov_0.628049_1_plen_37_part_01
MDLAPRRSSSSAAPSTTERLTGYPDLSSTLVVHSLIL